VWYTFIFLCKANKKNSLSLLFARILRQDLNLRLLIISKKQCTCIVLRNNFRESTVWCLNNYFFLIPLWDFFSYEPWVLDQDLEKRGGNENFPPNLESTEPSLTPAWREGPNSIPNPVVEASNSKTEENNYYNMKF
jgi:hypothetical protein